MATSSTVSAVKPVVHDDSESEGAVNATVEVADVRHVVQVGDVFTFGRSPDCTVCLDPEDTGISRQAGSVEHNGSCWWLVNRSEKRNLVLIDEFGLRSLLTPRQRKAVLEPVRVQVEGTRNKHPIMIEPSRAHEGASAVIDEPSVGTPTVIGEEVRINEQDKLAMVALFAGYLHDPPRYDPHPRSYEAAAKRLGWTRTQLLRRIEYLRGRLTKAGVPNLHGPSALYGLAEFALSRGVITKSDLGLLP